MKYEHFFVGAAWIEHNFQNLTLPPKFWVLFTKSEEKRKREEKSGPLRITEFEGYVRRSKMMPIALERS